MFSRVTHAPYVNLLKLVDESDVLLRGDASVAIDRTIGKKIFAIHGKIASDNFVQIPADRTQSLGLKGRYVYVQLKPSSGKHFVLNLTFTTAGHGSLTLSLSNGYRASKLLGTVLHVPYPQDVRWATVAIDVPRLLKQVFPTIAGDGTAAYVCLRSVHGAPSFALRAVFSSETLFSADSLPRDVIFPLPRGSVWEELYAWHALPAPLATDGLLFSPPAAARDGKPTASAAKGRARADENQSPHQQPHQQRPTTAGATASPSGVPTWATPSERPAPTPRPRLEASRVLSGHEGGAAGGGGKGLPGSSAALHSPSQLSSHAHFASPSRGAWSAVRESDHYATPPPATPRYAGGLAEADGASDALVAPGSGGGGSGAEQAPMLALTRAVGLNAAAPQSAVWLREGNSVCYAAGSLVVLHDVKSGAQRHLIGHTARVCALAVCGGPTPLLASAQQGKAPTIRLWHAASGACVGVLCAHASDLCALALSADGGLLAACGSDAGARQVLALWDVSAVHAGGAARLLTAKRTEHHIAQLKFCAGGADDEVGSDEERNRLVSCGAENICFWRLKAGSLRHCVADLSGHHREAFVAIALDAGLERSGLSTAASRRAFVSTASGKVLQLRVETRALEFIFQLHGGMISALHLTEAFCITGCADGTLRVWPLDFSEFLLEAEHDGPVTCVESSSDGLTILIAVDRVNSLGLMDLSTHRHVTLVRAHQKAVRCAQVDPRRRQFVTASDDLSVRVWDVDSGRQLSEFEATGELPTAVRYHPAEQCCLAVGYASGAVRLFDVSTTTMLHEYKLHAAQVLALCFDSAGTSLFSASADGALVAYDASKDYWPTLLFSSARPGASMSLELIPAIGAHHVAASVATARTRSSCGGGADAPDAGAAASGAAPSSAAGGGGGSGGGAGGGGEGAETLVACGLDKGMLLLFHARDLRRPPAQLELHGCAGRAVGLALSADHASALVGSSEGSLLRYSLTTGELTARLPSLHRGAIEAVAMSACGAHVVTAGADRIIKVWPVRTLFGGEKEAGAHGPSGGKLNALGTAGAAAKGGGARGGLPPHQAFVAHADTVCAAAFTSAVGPTQLVSVGADGLVALWDVSDAIAHAAVLGDTAEGGGGGVARAQGPIGAWLPSAQRDLGSAAFRSAAHGSTARSSLRAASVGSSPGVPLLSRASASRAGGSGARLGGGEGGSLLCEEDEDEEEGRGREQGYGAGFQSVVYAGARGLAAGAATPCADVMAPAACASADGTGYAMPDSLTQAFLSHPPSASPPFVLARGADAIGLTASAGAGAMAWRPDAGQLVFSSGAACVLDDLGGGGPRALAVLPGARALAVSAAASGSCVAFCDSAAPSEAFVWHAKKGPSAPPADLATAEPAELVRLSGFRARALALCLCGANGEFAVVLTDGTQAPVLSAWHSADGTLLAARAVAEGGYGTEGAHADEVDAGGAVHSAIAEDGADEAAALQTRPLRLLSALCEVPSALSPLAFAVAGAAGVQVWQLAAAGGAHARGARPLRPQPRRGRLVCANTWDVIDAEQEAALLGEGPPALASLGRALVACTDLDGRLALYHSRAGWTCKTEPLTDDLARVAAVHVASMAVGEEEVSWLLAVAAAQPNRESGGSAPAGALHLWRLTLAHPTQEAPAAGGVGLTPLLRVGLPAPACSLAGDDAVTLAATADGSLWHVEWAQALEQASTLACLGSSPGGPVRQMALSTRADVLVTSLESAGASVWWVGSSAAGGAVAADDGCAGPLQLAQLRTADASACLCVALKPDLPGGGSAPPHAEAAPELCALGFASGKVRLFDLSAVELLHELNPHARNGLAPAAGASPIHAVAFAHADVLLSANGAGEVVMCHYARSGTPTRLLRAATGSRPVCLEAGHSGAWLLLSEKGELSVWAAVPAESTGAGAMPGAVLDLTLVSPQLAGEIAPSCAVAAFVARPTSREQSAQAIVCAGVDVEGGASAPYAMAYDASTRNVIWSIGLEAPPDAIAAAAGKIARCAIALTNGTAVVLSSTDGTVLRRLRTAATRISCMRFGTDGSLYLAHAATILKMHAGIDVEGDAAP